MTPIEINIVGDPPSSTRNEISRVSAVICTHTCEFPQFYLISTYFYIYFIFGFGLAHVHLFLITICGNYPSRKVALRVSSRIYYIQSCRIVLAIELMPYALLCTFYVSFLKLL